MIIENVIQGSAAWDACRLGVITASEFKRIVTPTGVLSSQRDGYLAELLAEWALGRPVVSWMGNAATERGHAVEPEALDYFAMLRDVEPRKVGFVYRDDQRLVGCSPDFMVGDNPGELKCPDEPGIHLLRLIRGGLPKEYTPQVQGQIWVCEAEHGFFMDYYPSLPPVAVTVEPDEKYQAALDKHIPTFVDELLEGRERLRKMGILPALADAA